MDLTTGAPFWIIKDGLLAAYPRLLLLELFLQRKNPDLEIFRFDR